MFPRWLGFWCFDPVSTPFVVFHLLDCFVIIYKLRGLFDNFKALGFIQQFFWELFFSGNLINGGPMKMKMEMEALLERLSIIFIRIIYFARASGGLSFPLCVMHVYRKYHILGKNIRVLLIHFFFNVSFSLVT